MPIYLIFLLLEVLRLPPRNSYADCKEYLQAVSLTQVLAHAQHWFHLV